MAKKTAELKVKKTLKKPVKLKAKKLVEKTVELKPEVVIKEPIAYRVFVPNVFGFKRAGKPSHFIEGKKYPVFAFNTSYASNAEFTIDTQNELGEYVTVTDYYFEIEWVDRGSYLTQEEKEHNLKFGCVDDIKPEVRLQKSFTNDWLFQSGYYKEKIDLLVLSAINPDLYPVDLKSYYLSFETIKNNVERRYENLKIQFNYYVEINWCSTKIKTKDLETAFCGLLELVGEEQAVETITKIITDKLDQVF